MAKQKEMSEGAAHSAPQIKAEIKDLYIKAKQAGADLRQLSIDFRRKDSVHFIEYRAFEPQWQPKIYDLTPEQARDYFTYFISWAEAST